MKTLFQTHGLNPIGFSETTAPLYGQTITVDKIVYFFNEEVTVITGIEIGGQQFVNLEQKPFNTCGEVAPHVAKYANGVRIDLYLERIALDRDNIAGVIDNHDIIVNKQTMLVAVRDGYVHQDYSPELDGEGYHMIPDAILDNLELTHSHEVINLMAKGRQRVWGSEAIKLIDTSVQPEMLKAYIHKGKIVGNLVRLQGVTTDRRYIGFIANKGSQLRDFVILEN